MNIVTYEAIYVLFPKLTFYHSKLLQFAENVDQRFMGDSKFVNRHFTKASFEQLQGFPEINLPRSIGDRFSCRISFEAGNGDPDMKVRKCFIVEKDGVVFC